MSEAMDDSLWRHLPQNIIDLILYLLPVKSLCRFKCVSPEWNSLISSPEFSKTRDRLTSKPQKALLISKSTEALYLVNLADANPTAEKVDRFLPEQRGERHWYSPPCNGLLLRIGKNSESIFLFNPFTREYKKLPDIDSTGWLKHPICGFGYDSCTDDYKVVIIGDAAAVYSLKTNAWSRIEYSQSLFVEPKFGVYLNDSLHWFAEEWSTAERVNERMLAAAFDFSDEKFRMIELPNYVSGVTQMVVLRGLLCLIIFPHRGCGIEVWMMNEYGVTESWTKFTIANPVMDRVCVPILSVEDRFVVGTTGAIVVNGEIVVGDRTKDQLVLYDPKKDTVKIVIVPGIPTTYPFLGSSAETLISPNKNRQIMRHCEASSRVTKYCSAIETTPFPSFLKISTC